MMTKADYGGYLVQIIEWGAKADLGAAGILVATSAAMYFLGAYPVTAGDMIALNPLTAIGTADPGDGTTASFIITDTAYGVTSDDSSDKTPGWFGDAAWFRDAAGPWLETGLDTGPANLIVEQ